MASRLTATTATYATLSIRIALGSIMLAHGAQKVLGIWGGPGFNRWYSGVAPLAFLRPSWFWLGAAAFAEFVGGILILLGLFTRVGAFFVACVMLVAIAGVHWRNGFFLNVGGFEYALACLAMAITLLIMGGGNLSVDQKISGGGGK